MGHPPVAVPADIAPAPVVDLRRRYLGLPTAAEYSDLSKSYLLSLVHSGDLPAFRVGRRILIDQHDLDEFITAVPAVPA